VQRCEEAAREWVARRVEGEHRGRADEGGGPMGAPLTDGVSGGAGGAGSEWWHEKETSATME
jgi:hypothetical protein